jgi:hypothetical protein
MSASVVVIAGQITLPDGTIVTVTPTNVLPPDVPVVPVPAPVPLPIVPTILVVVDPVIPPVVPASVEADDMASKRKALIVAINTYPDAPLEGCVNDGIQDAREITANFGFRETNVRMLLDDRATTDAILDRLDWLVTTARSGDTLFFAYSGHGAQVPCRNDAGEVDGLSELVCPYNFDWTPEHMITDKQFVAIFAKLPKGVKLFWLSDSCHSGDLNRLLHNPPIRIKEFPMPADIRWSVEAAKKAGFKPTAIRELMAAAKFDVAFVPGCRSNQTSADTSVDGVPCGAATYYFWDAVHRSAKDATVKEIAEAARATLERFGYEQTPIADGSLINEPLLGM